MTLLTEILSHTPRACCFALPTGAVVYHFDLLPGLGFVVASVAVSLVILRPVSRVLPEWLRFHPRTIPVHLPDQVGQAESLTTAGGVALVAVIACLSTDPLKSADEDFESAIVVMVVLSAAIPFLCRAIAQDALSALRHGTGDPSPERELPARRALAFADVSIAMVIFTGVLVIVAVW